MVRVMSDGRVKWSGQVKGSNRKFLSTETKVVKKMVGTGQMVRPKVSVDKSQKHWKTFWER